MTASAVKQKPNAGIAIPIAASAVGGIGIAIAPRVVRDDALGLLRDGFALSRPQTSAPVSVRPRRLPSRSCCSWLASSAGS